MSTENIIKLILAIAALIGASAFITLKFVKKNSNNKTVNQNHNKVNHGDIVAGDKN